MKKRKCGKLVSSINALPFFLLANYLKTVKKNKNTFEDNPIRHFAFIFMLLAGTMFIVYNLQQYADSQQTFPITGYTAYQPTGYQGNPATDSEPNFAGTDNTAGSAGPQINVTVDDGDSIALEQPLTRENITIKIANRDYDPNSTLSGNFTLGTTTLERDITLF